MDGAEEKSEGGEGGMKRRGVGAMVKVFQFIMKQSYICALIAMMVSQAACMSGVLGWAQWDS